ncbi:MAG TPA: DUF6448 family protein [Terriglobales bacterium]
MKFIALIAAASFLLIPETVWAHCDTFQGPVVADAHLALDTGDVTPVLKWISPENESEIRATFQKTLSVRAKGADAREIADRYFFETLVRLRRLAENAAFTGLKDEPVHPSIVLADDSLESGSPDELVHETTAYVAAQLRQRFTAAKEAQKHAKESVTAGREYVARYVEFTHYVEQLHGSGMEGDAAQPITQR